jgi:aldehyde dehydrogenase (NAD+)
MSDIDGRLFIDGARTASAATVPTPDPGTGEWLVDVAQSDAGDVDQAVDSAQAALDGWRSRPPVERAAILTQVADAIVARTDEFAALESADVGKPLREARADVAAAAGYFRFYAGLADKILGSSIPVGFGRHDFTVREPVGVSAHIVPWNYPLQLSSRGIAPALACGNAVVVKPAHEAGLSIALIAEVATAAGLPAGLMNVVSGDARAGKLVASHPRVDHVTFTGSVPTGSAVMTAAAANVVPVTLELGGKSPMIVFPDADLAKAARTTATVIIQNAGQTCSAASRVIIHRSVEQEFLELLRGHLQDLRIGPGASEPDMGPVVSARQRDRIDEAVSTAVAAGAARVLIGGRRPRPDGAENGFYFEPTLLIDVDPQADIAQQEVFGPVLVSMPFDSREDAVALANGTPYGLVAGVWTRDLVTAHTVSQQLDCGQVFVNGYGAGGGVALPFGGRGRSGFGREKGLEALANYTATKNIMIHFEE